MEADTIAQRPIKFLVLGLYNAGKSSLINRLTHGAPPKGYIATKGVTVHALDKDETKLAAWHHVGRVHSRALSKLFYIETLGIIFMIDSSADARNLDESLEYLGNILQDEYMTEMAVMVVVNKQDCEDAVGPQAIEDRIKESCRIGPGVSLFVMPMSVTSPDDQRVEAAYHVFVNSLIEKKKNKEKEGQQGAIREGLIPHAWDMMTENVQAVAEEGAQTGAESDPYDDGKVHAEDDDGGGGDDEVANDKKEPQATDTLLGFDFHNPNGVEVDANKRTSTRGSSITTLVGDENKDEKSPVNKDHVVVSFLKSLLIY